MLSDHLCNTVRYTPSQQNHRTYLHLLLLLFHTKYMRLLYPSLTVTDFYVHHQIIYLRLFC
nr:MAG TPA: hypothetical protein [Caudoviricetes sp.]